MKPKRTFAVVLAEFLFGTVPGRKRQQLAEIESLKAQRKATTEKLDKAIEQHMKRNA